MIVTLTITSSPRSGEPAGTKRKFASDTFTFGRSIEGRPEHEVDWLLNDRDVSRFHGEISNDDSGVSIADTRSTNGIWVNGEKIGARERRLLQDGDHLKLGEHEFQVRIRKRKINAGFDDFLQGLGLSRADLPRDIDAAECLREAGETYLQVINGLHDILAARGKFKEAFGIGQTKIAAAQNNPLKVSNSAKRALLQMLTGENPGFKPAPTAMHEALTDIKTHQLALIEAVKVALASMLHQIDPEVLEERLGRSVFKTRALWETYKKTYKKLAKELDEDFRDTVGTAFREAYDRYLEEK